MEAPEKIYINDFGSELSYDWHTEHCCESDIEYTRTDAFIKKAVNYLDYKLSDIVKVRQAGTIIEAAMIKSEFIEDFKKAMRQ